MSSPAGREGAGHAAASGPVVGDVAVIIAAGGSGERLGVGVSKALVPVGGVPMLMHAVRAMAEVAFVTLVVVSAPAAEVEVIEALLVTYAARPFVRVVVGGATRQESVRRALEVVPPEIDIVLVHDAARALAPTALGDTVVAAIRAGARAAVPGLPLADTVKAVDSAELVTSTPDRATLRAVQTPQGFRRTTLDSAHAGATSDLATDDAGLVERLGIGVLVLPGSEDAFKITRPLDLVLAEAVLARRGAPQDARA